MLAPTTYKKDLERLYGRMLNHNPEILYKDPSKTKKLWNKMWPNEPFEMETEAKYNLDEQKHHQSQFEYDILSAVQRQKLFFYQVSLPHYQESAFLNQALVRYKMYLYLKNLYPQEFLVPCYDMDIIWHTHQVKPIEYEKETREIVGHHLPHDDSVNDRSSGSKLCNSEETTKKLWKSTFDSNFARTGSMFRGNPPQGKLWNLTEEFQKQFVRGYKYKIWLEDDILWTCYDNFQADKYSRNGELYLKPNLKFYPLEKGGSTKSIKHLPRMTKKKKSNSSIQFGFLSNDKDKNEDPEFSFEESSELSIHFEIEHQKEATDCFCFNYTKIRTVAESCNNIQMDKKLFDDDEKSTNQNETKSFDYNHKLSGKYKTNLRIKGSVTKIPNQTVWKKLTIDPGTFYDCIMPEQIEALWGPVPLGKLPPGIDNECKAVTHRYTKFSYNFYS